MSRIADLYCDKDGWSPIADSKPGDYWKLHLKDGGIEWYAHVPSGVIGNLSGHEVIEHEDGTITASPSILIPHGDKKWHGHLKAGVWSEA